MGRTGLPLLFPKAQGFLRDRQAVSTPPGPEQPPETQRRQELVQDSLSNAQIHNWAGTASLSHKNTAWKLTAPRAVEASCEASQHVARA